MKRTEAIIEQDIEALMQKHPHLREFNRQLEEADAHMQAGKEPVVGMRLDEWHSCICSNCLTWQEKKKIADEDAIFKYMIDSGELWLCVRCQHLAGMTPEEEAKLPSDPEGMRFITDKLKAIAEDLENDLVRSSPKMLQSTIAFRDRLNGILRGAK